MTNKELQQPESRTLDLEALHLLNNHLGVILGFVDLVLDDTPAGDPRHRDLMEIKQAAVAAVALVGPIYRPT